MSRFSARHALPWRSRRRSASSSARRHGLAAAALACAAALTTPAGAPASASTPLDACTTPLLADAMVNQGLPAPVYKLLASGKTTLVRLYMTAPGCLPAGASLQVTGATLESADSPPTFAPVTPQNLLPLPPLGPPTTAPVPASASDVLFVIPGKSLENAANVSFKATVTFRYTAPSGATEERTLTYTAANSPGLNATFLKGVPFNALVVPMGDGAKTVSNQYPPAADAALQTGMAAVRRALPVADRDQFNWYKNAGMVNLGSHVDPQTGETVNWMPKSSSGRYCGLPEHFLYIGVSLQTFRTAWNSIGSNPFATRALGEVWQDVSDGASTTAGNTCLEGYAYVPGSIGWGRTVADSRDPSNVNSLTGAIALMEFAHSVGAVAADDERMVGAFHSRNARADVEAPDRGYHIESARRIADARSAMHYDDLLWHDRNVLLEGPEWSAVQCALLDPLVRAALRHCTSQSMGYSAAGNGTSDGGNTFVLVGSTDGTAAGTRATAQSSRDGRFDPEEPSSEYRFVQSDKDGEIKNTGIPVAFLGAGEGHHTGHAGPPVEPDFGVFGAAVADASTNTRQVTKIALVKEGVELFSAERTAPPTVVAAGLQGTSVTITVQDEEPAETRVDIFAQCPGGTSLLSPGASPTQTSSTTAVFVVEADSSGACAAANLLYRVRDQFTATEAVGLGPVVGSTTGGAVIHTPAADTVMTAFQPLSVSGSGRDALGLPATQLVWTLTSQNGMYTARTTTTNDTPGFFVPPSGGFASGRYDVSMVALTAAGNPAGTATSRVVVLPDSDGDGLDDESEVHPCYPAADRDGRSALVDSDGDGDANGIDALPCTSRNNVTVLFDPKSLMRSSSGQNVTVKLSNPEGSKLSQLSRSDIHITQIAGYSPAHLLGNRDALVATSWKVLSDGSAEAKFDRSTLQAALNASPTLLGYVPIFIGTHDGRLRGVDASSPTVFP